MLPYFLPYSEQPHWTIPLPFTIPLLDTAEITIHAFGVLVALALVVATWVSRWHGSLRGQDPTQIVDACTWTAISGFVVAHVVSVVFYFPERLLEEPAQIFMIWNGLSSFGGFLGGAVGAFFYLRKRNLPVLAFVDTIAVGLAPGWVLGRLGCTVAHDHPGLSTDFFLAFDHPRNGPVHDLGFYEFLFALFLTVLVMLARRRKWADGAIPAMMCIVYAPVRFGLDFLRAADVKYVGLTPGQWFAVLLLVGGIVLWWYAWKKRGKDALPASDGGKGEDASTDESKTKEGEPEKDDDDPDEDDDEPDEGDDEPERDDDESEDSEGDESEPTDDGDKRR